MHKLGDDVFIYDTCSFASTIVKIENNKIGVPYGNGKLLIWYDLNSPKVEDWSDDKMGWVTIPYDFRIKGK